MESEIVCEVFLRICDLAEFVTLQLEHTVIFIMKRTIWEMRIFFFTAAHNHLMRAGGHIVCHINSLLQFVKVCKRCTGKQRVYLKMV